MNITNRVKLVLEHLPQTRNSDKILQIIYMQNSGMELTEKQIATFKKLPSFETIRRIRQKIQEGGDYLPTDPKVLEERRFKSYQMQQNAPTAKPQTIERILE